MAGGLEAKWKVRVLPTDRMAVAPLFGELITAQEGLRNGIRLWAALRVESA
jgi:hypothetical protein